MTAYACKVQRGRRVECWIVVPGDLVDSIVEKTEFCRFFRHPPNALLP